jgi:hypothetical protein
MKPLASSEARSPPHLLLGTERFDPEKSVDREVQRTMLKQLDSFGSEE